MIHINTIYGGGSLFGITVRKGGWSWICVERVQKEWNECDFRCELDFGGTRKVEYEKKIKSNFYPN